MTNPYVDHHYLPCQIRSAGLVVAVSRGMPKDRIVDIALVIKRSFLVTVAVSTFKLYRNV